MLACNWPSHALAEEVGELEREVLGLRAVLGDPKESSPSPSEIIWVYRDEIRDLNKRAEAAEAEVREDAGVIQILRKRAEAAERKAVEMEAAWDAVSKEARDLEEARDTNAAYATEARALHDAHCKLNCASPWRRGR
jgi:chromosome segregation ATPase